MSKFGCYWTKKFVDIYPKVEDFLKDYKNQNENLPNGIPTTISDTSVATLYYLLYSKYGNSHIVNMDENQFRYRVLSTIFQFGPTWEKKLDIQNKLRGLTDEELMLGGKRIYNHAYNPSTEPSTSSLEELTAINEQNTSNFKKGKLEAYALLVDLLRADVTGCFLDHFKKLFLVVVEPQKPLWYITNIEEEEENDT